MPDVYILQLLCSTLIMLLLLMVITFQDCEVDDNSENCTVVRLLTVNTCAGSLIGQDGEPVS